LSAGRAGRGVARGLVILLAGALAACANPARRPADAAALARQSEREAQLALQPEWSLDGRLAVSGGGEGGSGTLRWEQRVDSYRLEVQAPVTRQTWRLVVDPGISRLEGLEGGPREDSDAIALLAREVGWALPLADLGAWVRGARGAGPAQIEFAEDGLPARLTQHGWQVDYRDWDRSREPALPLRVFAQRGDQRVRLVVARWLDPAQP